MRKAQAKEETPAEKPARRGDIVTLDIEKFADEGKGLARHRSGLVVFVPQAVPGDRLRAKVTRRRKNFAEAKQIDLIEPSEKRIEPRCRYFGTCGGCDWQHVRYGEQARLKAQSVREALVHHGGVAEGDLDGKVQPLIEAEQPYFYRNKMTFDFRAHRWLTPDEIATGDDFDTDFALGLHVPKSPKVIDLRECHLQSRRSRRLVNRVRAFVKENGWRPWNVRREEGFLRHLILREPERTDDFMVRLVTSRHAPERIAALADFMKVEVPEAVTTFVHTFNDTPRPSAAQGGAHRTVFGEGVVREQLGGLTFEIGPGTFFQTNTRQAARLFAAARERADLQPADRLYDLYCGAGALGLFMADAVKEVIGIEGNTDAVAAARKNAEANGIGNARFFAGALEGCLTSAFAEKHGRPDVLLADPPRAGMREAVVKQIAALRPERLVYVSCDPQTQARDLKRLRGAVGGAYRITAVQPVDMFPQTAQVENVVALQVEGA